MSKSFREQVGCLTEWVLDSVVRSVILIFYGFLAWTMWECWYLWLIGLGAACVYGGLNWLIGYVWPPRPIVLPRRLGASEYHESGPNLVWRETGERFDPKDIVDRLDA